MKGKVEGGWVGVEFVGSLCLGADRSMLALRRFAAAMVLTVDDKARLSASLSATPDEVAGWCENEEALAVLQRVLVLTEVA